LEARDETGGRSCAIAEGAILADELKGVLICLQLSSGLACMTMSSRFLRWPDFCTCDSASHHKMVKFGTDPWL
jgi:hypothetical protein